MRDGFPGHHVLVMAEFLQDRIGARVDASHQEHCARPKIEAFLVDLARAPADSIIALEEVHAAPGFRQRISGCTTGWSGTDNCNSYHVTLFIRNVDSVWIMPIRFCRNRL